MAEKELTIAQIIDKNKISSDRVWLFAMKIYLVDANGVFVDTYRIAANSEAVTIDGEVYQPFPFTVSHNQNGSELGTLSITVQDQLGIIQTLMGGYYGMVGLQVELLIADFGSGTTTTTSSVIEPYEITTAACNDYVASFQLGAENPLSILVPKRMQWKDRCNHRYKSTECGYVGALTTCDFTMDGANGCVVHGVKSRIGTFPGLVIRG